MFGKEKNAEERQKEKERKKRGTRKYGQAKYKYSRMGVISCGCAAAAPAGGMHPVCISRAGRGGRGRRRDRGCVDGIVHHGDKSGGQRLPRAGEELSDL